MDHFEAGRKADIFIAAEIGRQDRMWGVSNDRADSTKGQLFDAARAQLSGLATRRAGLYGAFDVVPPMYPDGWSGFRDYGSDVANIVVAIAYLRQEAKRLITGGADTTRTSRDPQAQPYAGTDQPAVMER
jgi:hypothetical protein